MRSAPDGDHLSAPPPQRSASACYPYPLVRKVFFFLLSLAAPFTLISAAPAGDFPKGYLVYSTYAGGKLETVGFESIEIANQYNGTVKNAADRDFAFSTKLVTAVILLDVQAFDGMTPKMNGANSTFMHGKLHLADVADIRSDADDLKAQKKELDDLITAQHLKGPLDKVSEELGAAIARVEEAAKNAPAVVNTDPRQTEFSFSTVTGEQHMKVRVTAVTEAGVNLSMENGISRVAMDQIPVGARQFPEPWREEIVKHQQAIAKRIADEKKRIADEAAKKAAEEAAKKAEAEAAAKAAADAEAAKNAPAPAPATAEKKPAEPTASGAPAEAPKK